ncbi:MAG: TetR/AcrR family transcriptional regulator [Polyangiales bacterium]
MTGRLSAEAWTEMGLRVLAEEGIGAVQVEPLARALGVTKGSFYWHFPNRQTLLVSLLEHWRRSATLDVIEAVERACDDPADRLRELTRRVFRHGGPLERAIRAWASHDESAAVAVAEVDTERYTYVRSLLERHGLDSPTASKRARLLYTSLIGEQHAVLTLSPKRRVEWALSNLELLLNPSS